MTTALTLRQALVLRAIQAAANAGDRCPSNIELCDVAGCNSPSTCAEIVHDLERKGLIAVVRYSAGRQVTIVATGKSTFHAGSTKPHWSLAGPRPQSNLRTAPAALTPAVADRLVALAGLLCGDPADRSGPPSLIEQIDAECHELAVRRATARTFAVETPLPARDPRLIGAAEVIATAGDDRPVAWNREPCPRCQTRGDHGCAHQRPFVAEAR